MTDATRLQRRILTLRRLATLCALLVLMVTTMSAFIRLSNAGLGCPDWPQCYGSKLRQLQQGAAPHAADSPAITATRLAHRAAAVAALILILTMLFVCCADRPVLQREAASALMLLLLALLLAVLGRWTSTARVPAVAVGNVLGGFAMLALCWRLRQGTFAAAESAKAAPRGWPLVALLLVLQVGLGVLVSASYAGMSCTDFPGCGAHVVAQWDWQAFNPWHEPDLLGPDHASGRAAAAHMAHRWGALALLTLMVPLLISRHQRARRGALFLLALLAGELVLGVVMVTSSLPLWAEIAHNLGAALLLAAVISLL